MEGSAWPRLGYTFQVESSSDLPTGSVHKANPQIREHVRPILADARSELTLARLSRSVTTDVTGIII